MRFNLPHIFRRGDDDCESPDPANTLTDRLNTLLNSSGPGYVLKLCPEKEYLIQSPLLFAAPNQEISTVGYPTGNDRATLIVNGPVVNGKGHTTAVDGTCTNCSGVKLRNIQINGTRGNSSSTDGGANIEMGGQNSDQVIEYVRSYDPRSWSCLHIQEGALNCNNVLIQNNDIGPCGSDVFQQWADGISLACRNSIVRNNMIKDATDGGIVIFGSPGSLVENNTIWVETRTLLGGINMVDVVPFEGDYTGVVVKDNTIMGGFANDDITPSDTKGENEEDAVIKIGIAIGPRTWFGDRFLSNISRSGTVLDNRFTGAFSYSIAMTSASNFTVTGNTIYGNTSYIGARGENCSETDTVPTPQPFILDTNTTSSLNYQTEFQIIADGDSLTCVLPPNGGDFWPISSEPGPSIGGEDADSSEGLSGGAKAGIAIGVILGIVAVAVGAWFFRKWALNRAQAKKYYETSRSPGSYAKQQ